MPDYIYSIMVETLKELEKDGLVELKGDTVKVLDYSGLQALADKLDENQGLKMNGNILNKIIFMEKQAKWYCVDGSKQQKIGYLMLKY